MKKQTYGMVKGIDKAIFTQEMPVGASVTFKAQSGRFVYQSSNVLALCTASSAVDGAVEFIGTSSSTSGGTRIPVQLSCDVVYEVPLYLSAGTTQAESDLMAYIGKTRDIYVSGGIQYCNLDTGTYDVLTIVGFDVDAQTMYVTMNPAKVRQTA